MPLSEHEQRQLEAIERALYADDPKFAHAVRLTSPRTVARRRIAGGVLLIVLGLGVLLAGAVLSVWYVGVAGFLIMLAGATRGYAGVRRLAGGDPGKARGRGANGAPRRRPDHQGVRARLEERWRRRFEGP